MAGLSGPPLPLLGNVQINETFEKEVRLILSLLLLKCCNFLKFTFQSLADVASPTDLVEKNITVKMVVQINIICLIVSLHLVLYKG
jgi:hypothetical protein